jgi:alginate O-acetyltransferase complex protein AlgJ
VKLPGAPTIRIVALMVIAFTATISLGLGQSAGPVFPQFAIGKNGFIFEGLPDIARWDLDGMRITSHLDKQIDVIHAINKVLKKRNIKLIIALVPMVHTIYADQLPVGFVRPRLLLEMYGDIHMRLNQLGVETPNLEQPFLQHPSRKNLIDPLFMRADHHWSPPGALEAARVIGKYIQAKYPALLADIPEVKYAMRLQDRKVYWYIASLYKKLPLSEQARVKPDAIRAPEFTLIPNTSSSGDASGLGLGLLTDTTPRIVEVGSSFSHTPEFGFVGGLAQRLSRDVLNASRGGVEAFIPMAEYLASDAYQEHPPAMIIWEIPERLMSGGMKPVNNSSEWTTRQFLLEAAANAIGACQNGLPGRVTTTNGFQIQGPNASIDSSTGKSFVKYQFAAPIKPDQYLSLNVSSSTSDSLVVEGEGSNAKGKHAESGKRPRYFVKLGDYNVMHRVNVPLATLTNGKSNSLTIRVSPGSQLRLEGPMLCTAAPELMRLAGNGQ